MKPTTSQQFTLCHLSLITTPSTPNAFPNPEPGSVLPLGPECLHYATPCHPFSPNWKMGQHQWLPNSEHWPLLILKLPLPNPENLNNTHPHHIQKTLLTCPPPIFPFWKYKYAHLYQKPENPDSITDLAAPKLPKFMSGCSPPKCCRHPPNCSAAVFSA